EPLVAKQFGDPAHTEYDIAIVVRDDPRHVVYASSPAAEADARAADVSIGVFDLRLNNLHYVATAGDPRQSVKLGQLAITIVRRATRAGDEAIAMTGRGPGAWQVLVRGRNGSLEALVAQSRRRNLAISLGVLALLAGSFALIIGSAQRQQRLARQQMEFVAAVSHELRTPLAVICSAGENLADGVVADGAQVKRYGALVETEGRRLADMVERVLEFAGITAGTMRIARVGVDVARIVADAVGGLGGEAREGSVRVEMHDEGVQLAVMGDAAALRSAVQNLVGNAVKYSPAGTTVDVSTGVHETMVRVRVIDRGLGIDAADLPHVFKPFFRGRRALDAEIRGSGVGLSVVRHVVEAHQGRIQIESRPGEGTTVTLELPRADAGAAAGMAVAEAS
ncbi:MAG TPA: ATP-binding protein, partial [Vicinamibacterales bacterium]|nr:ATP-binding protein [Vicinamibacterales bacterium]